MCAGTSYLLSRSGFNNLNGVGVLFTDRGCGMNNINVIADFINQDDTPFVEQAIFGRGNAQQIAEQVNAFCTAHLGSSVDEYLFYESSQGAVFGIQLSDGRKVVLKGHQPERPLAFLAAISSVQRYLANHGYPCPRPLLDPTPIGHGHATVEELLDAGSYADAHDPAIRRLMAEMLARLATMTRDIRNTAGLQSTALGQQLLKGVLWPTPHSRIFDFVATAAGTEWIDALARTARQELAHGVGAMVIGHTDWSIKHFRFQDSKVCVIYDWDSLALDRETVIVGEAARGFTMTWHLDVLITPTPDEARSFVEEYETFRGQSFTGDERATVAAAATYALAYGARCEHCIDPRSNNFSAGSHREALSLQWTRTGNLILGSLPEVCYNEAGSGNLNPIATYNTILVRERVGNNANTR
jgi:Phosphotransferase enzyme family